MLNICLLSATLLIAVRGSNILWLKSMKFYVKIFVSFRILRIKILTLNFKFCRGGSANNIKKNYGKIF